MKIFGGSGSSNPTGWPLGWWASQLAGGSTVIRFAQAANTLTMIGFVLPCAITISNILFNVTAADGVGNYDIGIYSNGGTLLGDIGAQHLASTGVISKALIGAPLALTAGRYYLGTTGTAITATMSVSNPGPGAWTFLYNNNVVATSGGALPASQTPPADSNSTVLVPNFALSA